MKFTFAFLSLSALVALTLAAPSDLGRQVGDSVSQANQLIEKINSGGHAERREFIDWNVYGSNEAQAQLRLYEATDDAKLKKAYKDSVKEILAKMENERKVFAGTFKEEESSASTEESLMKAAKSMLQDAEERKYSGRAEAKVASLKDQIEWVEKKQNGGLLKDRVLLFQKMQGVNEMTQFY